MYVYRHMLNNVMFLQPIRYSMNREENKNAAKIGIAAMLNKKEKGKRITQKTFLKSR